MFWKGCRLGVGFRYVRIVFRSYSFEVLILYFVVVLAYMREVFVRWILAVCGCFVFLYGICMCIDGIVRVRR